jgi:hypothetical protein
MPWQDASPSNLMSFACVLLSPPQSRAMIVASSFLKVDTVAGAVVDTELADAFANRLGVTCVPLGQPIHREAIIARAR